MCQMGCPETLITDQGREFVNELSSELYQVTNTDHRITSAYHPQVFVLFLFRLAEMLTIMKYLLIHRAMD